MIEHTEQSTVFHPKEKVREEPNQSGEAGAYKDNSSDGNIKKERPKTKIHLKRNVLSLLQKSREAHRGLTLGWK